jgi:hypothetical protein
MHDTLGDGGQRCVTHPFLLLETLILRLKGGKKFCMTARVGIKKYFLYYSFRCSKLIRLKIENKKNVTQGGGGEKSSKSALKS